MKNYIGLLMEMGIDEDEGKDRLRRLGGEMLESTDKRG